MTITPYVNSSDNRVVNKSISQIYVTPLNVVFKGEVDMMRPVIEMSYDAGLLTCNYLHIAVFDRYYYVTKITTGAQRLTMECRIDVLQSHATEIEGFNALVARQADFERQGNLYLHDKEFRALAYKDVSTHKFLNSSGNWVKFRKDMNMILTVAGGASS